MLQGRRGRGVEVRLFSDVSEQREQRALSVAQGVHALPEVAPPHHVGHVRRRDVAGLAAARAPSRGDGLEGYVQRAGTVRQLCEQPGDPADELLQRAVGAWVAHHDGGQRRLQGAGVGGHHDGMCLDVGGRGQASTRPRAARGRGRLSPGEGGAASAGAGSTASPSLPGEVRVVGSTTGDGGRLCLRSPGSVGSQHCCCQFC